MIAAAPARLQLPIGQERTFSQAYYYAILAAGLYFIVASLLICTALGIYLGKYTSDVKLTFSQRTLMLQVILFLAYILAAAAVYARIESWDYLDGVYYITVTLFTIGFGDFSPKTHLGRGLFFPMAIGGILFVGLIVASISTLVLDRGSIKVSIRMVEKARHKALKRFDPQTGDIRIHRFRQQQNIADNNDENHPSELKRREQEFNLMREVQGKAANYNRTIAVFISLGLIIILWFIGAICFWQAEIGSQNWTYFQSLYFTYVSLLTIGYGDFYPQDNSAKPVFVLWALIALPTLTVLIGSLGGVINEGVNSLTLWIGDHLPEKSGALSAVKGEASKAKGSEFQEAKPPGFMSNNDEESADAGTDDQQHAQAVKGMMNMAFTNGNGTNKTEDEEATSKNYRQYLLMKEMRNVVEHLDATPPRQYSFAEWTWFLKLLGEDESQPSRHLRPRDVHDAEMTIANGSNRHRGSGAENTSRTPQDQDNDNNDKLDEQSWSWLGQRSPLMTATDEPKWVLNRLMGALEKELKEQGDVHFEREKKEKEKEKRRSDGEGDGKITAERSRS